MFVNQTQVQANLKVPFAVTRHILHHNRINYFSISHINSWKLYLVISLFHFFNQNTAWYIYTNYQNIVNTHTCASTICIKSIKSLFYIHMTHFFLQFHISTDIQFNSLPPVDAVLRQEDITL